MGETESRRETEIVISREAEGGKDGDGNNFVSKSVASNSVMNSRALEKELEKKPCLVSSVLTHRGGLPLEDHQRYHKC